MGWKYVDPHTLPREQACYEAIEELMDVPGLGKVKSIIEKYNLKFVAIDFQLKITIMLERKDSYNRDKNTIKHRAKEAVLDVPGLAKCKAILHKYNVSHFQIDKKMNITAKKSKNYCPLKHRKNNGDF